MTAGLKGGSRNRLSRTAARSAERWKSGQAPRCLSSNPGRAGSARPNRSSSTGQGSLGTQHPLSTTAHGQPHRTWGPEEPRQNCCLPCLLPNVYLRSVLTNTGDEPGGEKGTEGGERQGKGSCASHRHRTGAPFPKMGLSGHGAGSNQDVKPAFPVLRGDRRRCPQTKGETLTERETAGRMKARESRAPGPSTSTISDRPGSAW